MKLITLQKDYKMLLKDTITEYLSPNLVYLPIKDDFKLLVNPKDIIFKGQKIYDLKYSPISGNIIGIKELNNRKYLVINNDFKEKKCKKVLKKINEISKIELLEIIKNYNLKIYNKININANRIIINAIEEQPYVGNKKFICKFFNKEILYILDLLCHTLDIKDIQINFKDTDLMGISNINNIIGMYPNINIKLLPNKYLISNKSILSKYLNINEEFIYLEVEDLYNLYDYFENKKIMEEKLITITGNAINNPQVIKCKIGTCLKDILDEVVEFNNENYIIMSNNLLGNKICNNNIIIDEEIDSIFIMNNTDVIEKECIRCGKCNEYCPVNINVYNLVNNKKCDKEDCIDCGLCTYICPSYININKYLGGDYHE